MNLDSYAMGFFLVGGSVALAILGLIVVRRTLHRRDLRETQVVAGYLLSVVGTLYGVILGLIVVDSLGKFAEARLTTEEESNALADIFLLAAHLPEERKVQVQKHALAYLDSVIDVEWPMMARGENSVETRRLALALIRAVHTFEPKTNREQILFDAQVSATTQFWNGRRTRMVLAEQGMPALEWLVLVIGGVITVVFTYFFKADHLKLQLFMTSMLTTVIALNLYLVLMFAYPYSGDVMVEPDGFRISREIIRQPDLGLTLPP
jgi:Protein of unknown function (DUF4239)